MGKGIRKIAAYLSRLAPEEYGVAGPIVGAANYVLDSYFAKLDERVLRSRQRDRVIPDDLDAHIKELWLGCEIHKAISLNRSYPAFARSLNAYAFLKLFRQYAGPAATYEIVPFLDEYEFKDYLKGSRNYRIQYEQMNVAPGTPATMPIYGTFFIRDSATQAHLVVQIDLCYHSMGCDFVVMANPQSQRWAEKFFHDLQVSMAANDIYFKKCLSFTKGYLDFHGIIDTTWEEVVLKPEIKEQIRDNSVGILEDMDRLASIGMCPNRNLILISPPGMAKTTMFRATSNELDSKATRIWCTGKSIYYPEHVTSLFEAARSLAPCIVFIEDMDLFGGERTMLGRDSSVLNEFLAQLDGTQANSGIVVMASTNDIASMDEALVNRPGRFSVKVDIPYPDTEDRGTMLLKFLRTYNASPDPSVSKDAWDSVIALMAGFTGDYVKEVAKQTVIRATREGRNAGGRVTFTTDDLHVAGEQVIKNFQIGQRARRHHDVSIEGSGRLEVGAEKMAAPGLKLAG